MHRLVLAHNWNWKCEMKQCRPILVVKVQLWTSYDFANEVWNKIAILKKRLKEARTVDQKSFEDFKSELVIYPINKDFKY